MCLYPRIIRNRKYLPNKKNGGIVPEIKDTRTAAVPVKCGKCIECMKARQREWSIRLNEEIRTDNRAYFVTLTLSNEKLKELSVNVNETGYERDNSIITLACRRFLESWRKQFKRSIKHWFVSELGHTGTENVHLHGIIFTDNITELKKIWKFGFVFIGDYVNSKTVNYITKYVSKIDVDHRYYKPLILVSPGIGSGYIKRLDSKLNKYQGKNTREYYTYNNGTKANLPIYYRNKIYTDDEKEELWLNLLDKHERYVMKNRISIKESLDSYNSYVEVYRRLNQRLGYNSPAVDKERLHYEEELRNLNFDLRINQENKTKPKTKPNPKTPRRNANA